MPKKKQIVPGSIFVRKGTTKLTIKYRGRQYPTGIEDTVAGRKVVEEMLKQMHYNFINFNQLPTENISIYSCFEQFLAEHCKDLSERTKTSYKKSFKKITSENYIISESKISADIQKFVTAPKNLSPESVTTYLVNYSIFLNFCVFKKWLNNVPEILHIERKNNKRKEKKKPVETFEKEEYDMLIAYFMKKDREVALLLLLLWHTGGRIGETIRLKWSQIDMKNRRIVYSNKTNRNEDDYIPISSVVETILNELKKTPASKITNDIKKDIYTPDNVFSWRSATAEQPIRLWINAAMKELGIEKKGRSFHSVRRTYATNLFDKNVSIVDVKDLMRHKDIKTTLEHYKAKKAQRLEAIVEANVVNSETAPILHL